MIGFSGSHKATVMSSIFNNFNVSIVKIFNCLIVIHVYNFSIKNINAGEKSGENLLPADFRSWRVEL